MSLDAISDSVREQVIYAEGLADVVSSLGGRGVALPPTPVLSELLASERPQRLTTASDAASVALALFGVAATAHTPAAPYTRLHDRPQDATGGWMRADPVHLQADLSRVFLLRHSGLALTDEEQRRLAADLQPWFGECGLEFDAPHRDRWYIRLSEDHGFSLPPPQRALGADLARLIPAAAEFAWWRRLLNETQMFLHQHAVNQRRQAQGLPLINSLWFWGAGYRESAPTAHFARVTSDDPLLRGLAAAQGLADSGAALHHWQPQPGADLTQALLELETLLIEAESALGAGQLSRVTVQLDDGRYWRTGPRGHGWLTRWRRRWRRPPELTTVLQS
ncbi:MAG: hypothetical protein Tsb002_29980 [Wenzhouxiangellaceae bacterium]